MDLTITYEQTELARLNRLKQAVARKLLCAGS